MIAACGTRVTATYTGAAVGTCSSSISTVYRAADFSEARAFSYSGSSFRYAPVAAAIALASLQNGDRFPALSAPKVGEGTLSLPGDLAGSFGVVLFYRGSWCPYCNAQLSGFERAKDRLANVSVEGATFPKHNWTVKSN